MQYTTPRHKLIDYIRSNPIKAGNPKHSRFSELAANLTESLFFAAVSLIFPYLKRKISIIGL